MKTLYLIPYILLCVSCSVNQGPEIDSLGDEDFATYSRSYVVERLRQGFRSKDSIKQKKGAENIRFVDREPYVFSKEQIIDGILLLKPTLSLINENSNLYLKLELCNQGGSKISFHDIDESEMLRSKIMFYFDGQELGDFHIFAQPIRPVADIYTIEREKVSIDVNKCHENIYNMSRSYRTYNLKGRYSALYRSKVEVEYIDDQKSVKREKIHIQSNVATLVVR